MTQTCDPHGRWHRYADVTGKCECGQRRPLAYWDFKPDTQRSLWSRYSGWIGWWVLMAVAASTALYVAVGR